MQFFFFRRVPPEEIADKCIPEGCNPLFDCPSGVDRSGPTGHDNGPHDDPPPGCCNYFLICSIMRREASVHNFPAPLFLRVFFRSAHFFSALPPASLSFPVLLSASGYTTVVPTAIIIITKETSYGHCSSARQVMVRGSWTDSGGEYITGNFVPGLAERPGN